MHAQHALLRLLLLLLFLNCCATVTSTSKQETPRRNRNRNRHRNRKGNPEREASPTEGVAEVMEACQLEVSCPKPAGGVALTVRPLQGPRGPPGKVGEPGIPGRDGVPGRPGSVEGAHGPLHPPVAFFVGLRANIGPVSDDTDLIFDSIVTNVGQAYDKETGRFTAPYNGTFQFTVVVAAQGRQRNFVHSFSYTGNGAVLGFVLQAAVDLVSNKRMVATIWAESIPYWASATNSAILSLKAGDQVWLVLQSRASYIHGYMYSTFSGWALFAEGTMEGGRPRSRPKKSKVDSVKDRIRYNTSTWLRMTDEI